MKKTIKRCLITVGKPDAHKEIHFGHLSGGLIYADIYSRFLKRELGYDNVLFLSGTECYGSAVETSYYKNRKENETIEEYIQNMHNKQLDTMARFQIEFDNYFCEAIDHTLHKIHTEICQKTIDSLEKNNDLIRKSERFLTENNGLFLNYREISSRSEEKTDTKYNTSQEHYRKTINNLISNQTGQKPLENFTENYFIQFSNREKALKLMFSKDATEYLDYLGRALSKKEYDSINCFRITGDSNWGIDINICGQNKKLWVWIDSILAPISFTIKQCGNYDNAMIWWGASDSEVIHYIAEDNLKFYCALESYLFSSWNDAYKDKLQIPKLKLTAMRTVKTERTFPTGNDLLLFYTPEQIRYTIAGMGNRSSAFEPIKYNLNQDVPDNISFRCNSALNKIDKLIRKAKHRIDANEINTPSIEATILGKKIYNDYLEEMYSQNTHRVIDIIEKNLKFTTNSENDTVYFSRLFLYILYPILPKYSIEKYRYLFNNDDILNKNTFDE